MIELLVVVGVVATLATLLISAVQAAREASRRLQCQANLRQIGLALHGYHGAANCFPPGRYKTYDPRYRGSNLPCSATTVDASFLVHLLPCLELDSIYNAANHSLAIRGPENATVWPIGVAVYCCPSDTGVGSPRWLSPAALASYSLPDPPTDGAGMAYASYSGCFGSLDTYAIPIERYGCRVTPRMISQNNGCLNDLPLLSFASVMDGLSQTIAVAEKATGRFRSLDDSTSGTREFDRYGWYVSGNFGDTLFNGLYPPNHSKSPGGSLGNIGFVSSASSEHPGGLNVLMADGSARFVKETIQSWPLDPETLSPVGATRYGYTGWENLPPSGVWQSLCTRAGGEPLGGADY